MTVVSPSLGSVKEEPVFQTEACDSERHIMHTEEEVIRIEEEEGVISK